MAMTVKAISAALLMTIGTAMPAAAADRGGTSNSTYTVRFFGLTIAHADFKTTTKGDRYAIDGTLDSAGIAALFDSIHGVSHVRGVIEPDRLQASSYVVDYTSGKKKERTKILYRSGDVIANEQTPKPKKHGKHWVPIGKGDLKSVVDPISSLILPAGRAPCPRTIPVFDGETRADLKLSPDGHQPLTTPGFSGRAIVCAVRFVPKAGYKKGNHSIEFLRGTKGIEVWFARSPAADFYAPVYARIPTRVGSVTVSASRFGR